MKGAVVAQAHAWQDEVDRIARMLGYLASQNFYGQLELTFQAGRVVSVRKTEVTKLTELKGD